MSSCMSANSGFSFTSLESQDSIEDCEDVCEDEEDYGEEESCSRSLNTTKKRKREKDDVEDVIVKVSDKDEGPFPTVKEKDLTRDSRFPIRVTLQFYKATSNGVMDDATMKKIADQIVEAQKDADFIGSLVTGRSVHRPTAHDDTDPYHINFPIWWKTYWTNIYQLHFRKFPEVMIRKSAEFVLMNSSKQFHLAPSETLENLGFVQEVLASASEA